MLNKYVGGFMFSQNHVHFAVLDTMNFLEPGIIFCTNGHFNKILWHHPGLMALNKQKNLYDLL